MEPLWYEKEKQHDEREEKKKRFQDTPIVRELSELKRDTSITGPWEFVSNHKRYKVVYKASDRQYDPVSQISKFTHGEALQFEMGRFITDDPDVVDFLISMREFGNMFIAAFNVDRYKESRRENFGVSLKGDYGDYPKEPIPPTRRMTEEEEVGYLTQDVPEDFVVDSSEEVWPEETRPKIHTPSPEEVDNLLSTPYSPPANEKVDKLEERMQKMELILDALSDKLLTPKKLPEELTIDNVEAHTEQDEYYEEEPKKTFECKKCGKKGFTSGNAVREHRRSGECNRILARKLQREMAGAGVHTGMRTAR